MATIPTPSFFRIRLVVLIIAFVVFCFVVGVVKNAFAAYPGKCQIVLYSCTAYSTYGANVHTTWVLVDGNITQVNPITIAAGTTYYGCNASSYYNETTGTNWVQHHNFTPWVVNKGVGTETSNKIAFLENYECTECEEEKAAKAIECGGEEYIINWDDSTCTGQCDDSCADEKTARLAQCLAEGKTLDLSTWDDETCSGSCLDPCEDQREDLIEYCGGNNKVDWSTWNQETCTGDCSICDYEEYLKSRNECPSSTMHRWDESTCTGYCEGAGECTQEQVAAAIAACSPHGIAYMDVTDPSCPYRCNRDCADKRLEAELVCGVYGVGAFNWETCEYSCAKCPQKKEECAEHCSTRGGVHHIDCAQTSGGTVISTCVCEADVEPDTPDPGVDPPEPENPPDDKDPEDPNPDNPDDPSDGELKAINKNLGKLIEQGNDRGGQLTNIDGKLKWIGDNSKIIADNTGKTVSAIKGLKFEGGLDSSDKNVIRGIRSGIGAINSTLGDIEGSIDGALDGFEDGLDEVNENLEEIMAGEFVAPSERAPYESEEHNFSDRSNEFLTQMKTTGLFSLPDQLSSSIPGGGNPLLTIEGGETFGNHTIDFSNFSSALSTLGYLFHILGMILAIRIVTLKR